ncbi:hypothetical protein BIW11_13497 [Tropilaelaps mercedesae]|uniref:BMERB domain-containing protein n=1 Tax=Tropilaelaps mercedesae TaxID=418985 RepID=A0A1V9X1W6_9ACAR|nr:hypothetical protein BIW11_13497 [Tropilaelaps mercedesae]
MLHRPPGRFAIEPEFLTTDRPLRICRPQLPRVASSPSLAPIEALSSKFLADDDNYGKVDNVDDPQDVSAWREHHHTQAYGLSKGHECFSSRYLSQSEIRTLNRSRSTESISRSTTPTSNGPPLTDHRKPTPAPRPSRKQQLEQASGGVSASLSAASISEAPRKPKIDYSSILVRRVDAHPGLSSSQPRRSASSWNLHGPHDVDRKSQKHVSFEDLTALPDRNPPHSSSYSHTVGERSSAMRGSSSLDRLELTPLDLHPVSTGRNSTYALSLDVAPIRRTDPTTSILPGYAGCVEKYLEYRRKRPSLESLRRTPIESTSSTGAATDWRPQTGNASYDSGTVQKRHDPLDISVLSSSRDQCPKRSLLTDTEPAQAYTTKFKKKLSSDPNKIFERESCPSTSASAGLLSLQTGDSHREENKNDSLPSVTPEPRSLFKSYSVVEPPAPPSRPPPVETESLKNFRMSSRLRSFTDLSYSEGLAKNPLSASSYGVPTQYSSLKNLRADFPLSSPCPTGSSDRLNLRENPLRKTAEIYDMFPSNRNSWTEGFPRSSSPRSSVAGVDDARKIGSAAKTDTPLPPRGRPPPSVYEELVFSAKDKGNQMHMFSENYEVSQAPSTNTDAKFKADAPSVSSISATFAKQRLSTRSNVDLLMSFALGTPRNRGAKPLQKTTSLDTLHKSDGPAKPSTSVDSVFKTMRSTFATEPLPWTSHADATRTSGSALPIPLTKSSSSQIPSSVSVDFSRKFSNWNKSSKSATPTDAHGASLVANGLLFNESEPGRIVMEDVDTGKGVTEPITVSDVRHKCLQSEVIERWQSDIGGRCERSSEESSRREMGNPSPLSRSTTRSQLDTVSVTPATEPPPKPPRGNLSGASFRGDSLPRNMERSKNPFDSDDDGYDEDLSKRPFTLELCRGIGLASKSTTSLDAYALGNNPRDTDPEETDAESLASTNFTSFYSRNALPPSSSTPNSTLNSKRKFGGTGLTTVWPTTAKVQQSSESYDSSRNPFAESDGESVLSMASSSVVSMALSTTPASTKSPPPPPPRKKTKTKRRAPPPPVQPVKAQIVGTPDRDRSTVDPVLPETVFEKTDVIHPSEETKQKTAFQLDDRVHIAQEKETNDRASGGDQSSVEDKLRKLDLSINKEVGEAYFTDDKLTSSAELNISRQLLPLPPLQHEIRGETAEDQTLDKASVVAQAPPPEASTDSTGLSKTKPLLTESDPQYLLPASNDECTVERAELDEPNNRNLTAINAGPQPSPRSISSWKTSRSFVDEAVKLSSDTGKFENETPVKDLSGERRRMPALPTPTSSQTNSAVPEKSTFVDSATVDKQKDQTPSNVRRRGSFVDSLDERPKALPVHPMLAFARPLVNQSDVLDTDDDDVVADTSSTSCSDSEQAAIAEESSVHDTRKKFEGTYEGVSRDRGGKTRSASLAGSAALRRSELDWKLEKDRKALVRSGPAGQDDASLVSGPTVKNVAAKQPRKKMFRRWRGRFPKRQPRPARPLIVKYIYITAPPPDTQKIEPAKIVDTLTGLPVADNAKPPDKIKGSEAATPSTSEKPNQWEHTRTVSPTSAARPSQANQSVESPSASSITDTIEQMQTADPERPTSDAIKKAAEVKVSQSDVSVETRQRSAEAVTLGSAEDMVMPSTTSVATMAPLIPPPEFNFEDPVENIRLETVLPLMELVTAEEFEIHENQLPDDDGDGDDWDCASTSDSSLLSEEDNEFAGIALGIQPRSRCLSVIIEYPEEESEEKEFEKICPLKTLHDEFTRMQNIEQNSVQNEAPAQIDVLPETESEYTVGSDGTVFFSPGTVEQTDIFEVHNVEPRVDIDADLDTAEEGEVEKQLKAATAGDAAGNSEKSSEAQSTKLEATEKSKLTEDANESTVSVADKQQPNIDKTPEDAAANQNSTVCKSSDVEVQNVRGTIADDSTKTVSENEDVLSTGNTKRIVTQVKGAMSDEAQSVSGRNESGNERTTTAGESLGTAVDATIANIKEESLPFINAEIEPHFSTAGPDPPKAQGSSSQKEMTITNAERPPSPANHPSPNPAGTAPIPPNPELKIEILDNISDEDFEDPVATLNNSLLRISMRRRKLQVPEAHNHDADSYVGSTEDLTTPSGRPDQGGQPKAKTLPLPPVGLISRRYSADDVQSHGVEAAALAWSIFMKARSNSIIALLPKDAGVTPTLVAEPSTMADKSADISDPEAAAQHTTISTKLAAFRSVGVVSPVTQSEPDTQTISKRPPRRPAQPSATDPRPTVHRKSPTPPHLLEAVYTTRPSQATKSLSATTSISPSTSSTVYSRPAPPIPRFKPRGLAERFNESKAANKTLASDSSNRSVASSGTALQNSVFPTVPPSRTYISPVFGIESLQSVAVKPSVSPQTTAVSPPEKQKSLAERFAEAQVANRMNNETMLSLTAGPLDANTVNKLVPPSPVPPVRLRSRLNPPSTASAVATPATVVSTAKQQTSSGKTVTSVTLSSSGSEVTPPPVTPGRVGPATPIPSRAAPGPPTLRNLSHIPPPLPVNLQERRPVVDPTNPPQVPRNHRCSSQPMFPTVLPAPSAISQKGKSSLQGAHFRPPPPVLGPAFKKNSNQLDGSSTQVVSPSNREDGASLPLHSAVPAQMTGEETAPLRPQPPETVSTALSGETFVKASTAPGPAIDDSRNSRRDSSVSALGQNDLENASSNEDELLERSRTVTENEAERILGRDVDFLVEESRLSRRKRNIEEKQANLSAEARIIERQILESAKDSSICSDYPRIVLDQSVGKYLMLHEENAELFQEDLVADLFRILSIKNQLSDKYNQLKFLQRYNELQHEQTDIEARLRNLISSPDGGTSRGRMSFVDSNYEKALMDRLMEVITQRNRLVETMDEQNQRKKTLDRDLSQSFSDLSLDSFSSTSLKSSKSLSSLEKIGQANGKAKKKRHGIKHFLKKRYNNLIKMTSSPSHGSLSQDRVVLTRK